MTFPPLAIAMGAIVPSDPAVVHTKCSVGGNMVLALPLDRRLGINAVWVAQDQEYTAWERDVQTRLARRWKAPIY
jgi:hypothetical protein